MGDQHAEGFTRLAHRALLQALLHGSCGQRNDGADEIQVFDEDVPAVWATHRGKGKREEVLMKDPRGDSLVF